MEIAVVLELDNGDALAELERRAVFAALEVCSGNISQTARRLGISRSTLQRMIRRWCQTAEPVDFE